MQPLIHEVYCGFGAKTAEVFLGKFLYIGYLFPLERLAANWLEIWRI